MKDKKKKIILSKGMAVLFKISCVIIGLSIGYFLGLLLDGWKLWLAIFLFIIIGYIVFIKLLPNIYENNKDRF